MKLDQILREAGFRGDALRKARAIVLAESGGRATAHNPNASTGDNSYGLFQINMLGAMGPERRRQFGLRSNEELFDPVKNARIAFQMSRGGKDWSPWSTYKSGAYKQFLSAKSPDVSSPQGPPSAPNLLGPPSLMGAMGTPPGMPDLTSTLLSSFGAIARGAKPTETLTDVVTAASMPEPVNLNLDLAAAAPASAQPGRQTQTPRPGGGWGGSYRPAMTMANLGAQFGLSVTSEKRERKSTASGGVSDHWTGSKNAYAVDLGGTTDQMRKAAIAIAKKLGVSYNGRGPLVLTKTVGGLRYQVLWNTQVGGDHTDHIHVGVKRS